jgi:hypothetical protein
MKKSIGDGKFSYDFVYQDRKGFNQNFIKKDIKPLPPNRFETLKGDWNMDKINTRQGFQQINPLSRFHFFNVEDATDSKPKIETKITDSNLLRLKKFLNSSEINTKKGVKAFINDYKKLSSIEQIDIQNYLLNLGTTKAKILYDMTLLIKKKDDDDDDDDNDDDVDDGVNDDDDDDDDDEVDIFKNPLALQDILPDFKKYIPDFSNWFKKTPTTKNNS